MQAINATDKCGRNDGGQRAVFFSNFDMFWLKFFKSPYFVHRIALLYFLTYGKLIIMIYENTMLLYCKTHIMCQWPKRDNFVYSKEKETHILNIKTAYLY